MYDKKVLFYALTQKFSLATPFIIYYYFSIIAVHSYLVYPGSPGPCTARNFEMSVTPNHIHLDGEKAIINMARHVTEHGMLLLLFIIIIIKFLIGQSPQA